MWRNVVLVLCALGAVSAGDPCAPECSESDEGLYPHPQDCTKFYQCSHGTAFIIDCQEGLVFNPITLVCDYPDVAGCTADPDYDCGGTTELSSIDLSTAAQSTDCVPPCPSDTAIYANPKECNTYFVCFGGVPFLQTCSPGQEYNPAAEVCEDAGSFVCTAGPNEPCVAVTGVTGATTGITTTPSTTPVVTSTTTATTASQSTTPSDCVPPCPSSTAIYANPKECNTYFVCFGGVPFLQTCSPGQEYNPAAEVCEDAGSFVCTAGPNEPCVAVTGVPFRHKK